MKRYFIYGAGGHGKVVLDAMQSANQPCNGFIDNKIMQNWCDLPVINEHALENEDYIHLAIGDGAVRQKIAAAHPLRTYFSIFHPAAILAKSADISNQGVFVAAGAVIGPGAIIGDHTIINHGAIVDHDCKVGKFCHIAPNSVLGGSVEIGNNVLLGAGAVVLPGLTICDNVVVGAGAVVTGNISTPQTVIGIPAKNIDTF